VSTNPKDPLDFEDTLAELQRLGRTVREPSEDGTTMHTIVDIGLDDLEVPPKPGQTLGSALLDQLFNVDTAGCQTTQCCGWCKNPVGVFRDGLSRKEFGISAMCQICQDKAFAEPDEEDYDLGESEE